MSIQEEKLKAIADAIREKDGSTGTIVADDFADRIKALPSSEMVLEWKVLEPGPIASIQVVGYGDGKFVALSIGMVCSYSNDCINWTNSTLPVGRSWSSIAYGDGKFVALANGSNTILYSEDGITWSVYETSYPASGSIPCVIYNGEKFFAVSPSLAKIAYSDDGLNWETSDLPSSSGFRSIAYGNGKFVSLGIGTAQSPTESTEFIYSSDGINWTVGTLPSAKWKSVTYGGGKFVAISFGSNVAAYSTDGITWKTSELSTSAGWYDITYGEGKFVAVAYTGGTKTSYSFDGINWNTSLIPTSFSCSKVIYGSSKFLTNNPNGSLSTATPCLAYATYHALDTSDADATAGDILSPKTAYVNGAKVTGTIATKEEADVTVSGATVTTPAGYYKSQVAKSVTTVTHPAPTQALILGTYATIRANHEQASGYVTGSTTTADYNVTRNAGGTKTPGTSNQTLLSSGLHYLNNPLVMSGSSNLVSSNIRNGVNIFGITGTLSSAPSSASITLSSDFDCTVMYANQNSVYNSANFGRSYGSTTITALIGSMVFINSSGGSRPLNAPQNSTISVKGFEITYYSSGTFKGFCMAGTVQYSGPFNIGAV